MKTLGVLITIVCASAASFDDPIVKEWELYKTEYNKSYASDGEERNRMKIFMENRDKILKHNELYENNEVSYALGINDFSDMTAEEFSLQMGKTVEKYPEDGDKTVSQIPVFNRTIPSSINWIKKGAVTNVKRQGGCGACWAFSSAGALEGQYFLKTGKLVSLSSQNLIDCCRKNKGCKGGNEGKTFECIKNIGGINTEKAYPYKEKNNNVCYYNPRGSILTVKSYVRLPSDNELVLQEAVAFVGPITVSFETKRDFQHYKKGVYHVENCGSAIDHSMLAVGYGTTKQGQKYWLVKNSWGKNWGESGYAYVRRGKNTCGIATDSYYPIVQAL